MSHHLSFKRFTSFHIPSPILCHSLSSTSSLFLSSLLTYFITENLLVFLPFSYPSFLSYLCRLFPSFLLLSFHVNHPSFLHSDILIMSVQSMEQTKIDVFLTFNISTSLLLFNHMHLHLHSFLFLILLLYYFFSHTFFTS